MKVAGIIAEYNPFHNGHEYQVKQVKEECDAVVAVMSGNVVQRGTLAVYDKFMRARAAVLGGVDLVIELPCVYTLAPAELFAKGAIAVLNATKAVTDLYFGSECGDTHSLKRAAEIMLNEPPEVSQRIKESLRQGNGYKLATLEGYVGTIPAEILNAPNNLLGIEYIKAIIESGSKIEPHALLREFANHNDTSPSNNFASGNTIRDLLDFGLDIAAFIPPITYPLYEYAEPVDRTVLDAIVMYALRIKGMKEFNKVFDATPDMVARILRAIPNSITMDDIMSKTQSRQYSNARIRRVLMSMILDIDGKLINSKPEYIRVLAFNDKGRKVLDTINKKCKLPVIVKAADYKERSPMFEAEIRATELASVCRGVRARIDYTTSPYYIRPERYEVKNFLKPPIPPYHQLRMVDRVALENEKQKEEKRQAAAKRFAERQKKKREKAKAKARALARDQAEAKAQAEAMAQAEAQAQAQAEAKTQAEAKAKAQVQAEAKAKAKGKAKAQEQDTAKEKNTASN